MHFNNNFLLRNLTRGDDKAETAEDDTDDYDEIYRKKITMGQRQMVANARQGRRPSCNVHLHCTVCTWKSEYLLLTSDLNLSDLTWYSTWRSIKPEIATTNLFFFNPLVHSEEETMCTVARFAFLCTVQAYDKKSKTE